MKLLICTQVVDRNDAILGFFHRWIEEFAKRCEHIIVICLFKGEFSLPKNVTVISLGKERGSSRIMQVFALLRAVVAHRREYDAVFVHMNHEYLMVAGILWRLMRKPVGLWYVHKAVTWRLRIGTFFSEAIFSVSHESFRLKTRKLHMVGHGIDTSIYKTDRTPRTDVVRIITVGRISATKRLLEMLAALSELQRRGIKFEFTIVGAAVYDSDKAYKNVLREAIDKSGFSDAVHMRESIPLQEVIAELAQADVFLNASKTGSVDKAVLEAMAAGVIPAVANEAFRDLLSPYGLYTSSFDPVPFADVIERAAITDNAPFIEYVRKEHALPTLIPHMLSVLQQR